MGCVRSVLLLAVFISAACGAEPPPQRPPIATWRQAGAWSGRGNQQLETFPIQGGPMRVHWEAKNAAAPGKGHLRVRLQSGDSGRILAEPVDVRGGGAGTVDLVLEHHRIYATVDSADVDWSIRVEEAITRPR